jgi:hypothetical protein
MENDFMPHGHCYLWQPEILWTHAISDAVIGLAYFTIPFSLLYLVKKRKDLQYVWLFVLFAIFILGCGATHIFSIITIWNPLYRLDGFVKVVTALASIGTAIMLIKIMPAILVIPSIDQWKKLNDELLHSNKNLVVSNEELSKTEELLRSMNEDLEARVIDRTIELERKNVELLRINTDLDNFVYTASHDLRSPISNLTALMTVLTSSLEKKISPEEKEIIKMINHSVSRFTGTINDLSEIAKIQKESSNDVELISLDNTLREVKENMATEIGEGNVEIQEMLEENELYFSRKNLRSILYNLLSNAIKYKDSSKASFVKISSYKEDEFIVISFKDNGLGFDIKRKDKIFSMFKRLHDHVEGSGLGLYIIKRIVENAGGKVDVDSEVGVGSEFKIYIKRPNYII